MATVLLATGLLALLVGCTSVPVADADPRLAAGIEDALANADRSAADQRRDSSLQPAAVLSYLGAEPGMTVLELVAGDGYYTEALALAVGREGRVYAQNPDWMLALRDGINEKAMRVRLAGNRLPNVVRWDRDFPALGLGADSVDLALIALAYHELVQREDGSAAAMLWSVYQVLKPGGHFGVIDHVGIVGADNAALGRIVPAQIKQAAFEAGFVLDGRSDLLASFSDDHRLSTVDARIRGRTDRVIYRFRKPER
ncbi:MAG: SAM-dependent methyltransferase [Pseudomonadota bacterium]